MSNKYLRQPKFANSPSWREGGRNILGLLIVTIIMFLLFCATLLMAVPE
jgi:hypothetical protein